MKFTPCPWLYPYFMKIENEKMKNEKLLEIYSALGSRKRRKVTEARSTTAKSSITYNTQ